MDTYQYKVAVSYAGEQRAVAEAIAKCIQHGGGGPVFYDGYEKAALWGKDLYEHLTEIYQNKAEFCIIIASKEYVEKVWTTHERKSAQARALREKGREYILPVDFDGTKVPGLLDTISYLEFSTEGVQGICNAFLEKVGVKGSGALAPAAAIAVSSSPRAVVIWGKTVVFAPVVRSTWGTTVSLLLEPDDPTDSPALSGVKPGARPVLVAYQHNVAICRLIGSTNSTEGRKAKWELELAVEEEGFSPDMEVGTSGTSAEQFAEQRARRLLLNENPARETQDVNEIMLEILRRGQSTKVKVERSPFPELFKALGQNRAVFLESAWITAAMQLRLSGCVETVNTLRLEIREASLLVDFVGTRHRKYRNVDPYVMRIKGECPLQG